MQPVPNLVQVEVDKGVFVRLPQPIELGQELNVSQLLTAQWGENKEQKLLMQLQVDQKSVVLAGFSAFGARILSISYSGKEIKSSVLTGLGDKLPKPEQVLFNVMLSIWPVNAWSKPLGKIGWELAEQGLKRELMDQNGQIIAEINYQRQPYINGIIVFKHNVLDYSITIETKK